MNSSLSYPSHPLIDSVHRLFTKWNITLVFNRIRNFDRCAHTSWCIQAILTRFGVVSGFSFYVFSHAHLEVNGKELIGMHANWRPWFGESKGFYSGLNVNEKKNEFPPKAFKCLWMMLIARSIWDKVLPWRYHLGDFFSQNFHPREHRLPLK